MCSKRNGNGVSGRLGVWGIALTAGMICGCGSKSVPVEPGSQAPARVTERVLTIEQYSVEQIGGTLGGYLPPLDDGRIRVAPPATWHVAPRSQSYVVRFMLDETRRAPLPRITVTVAPAEFTEPADLSEETLIEFVKRVEGGMSASEREALVELFRPMVLGSVPCIRAVVAKRFKVGSKTFRGEAQVIKTLHNSRIYTITLDVYEGSLLENKNKAYVVVAGLEFLDPDRDAAPKRPPAGGRGTQVGVEG